MNKTYNFQKLLRTHGEKITEARLSILSVLSREHYPISIKELSLKVKAPNQSTLYRTVKTLVEKNLVKEIFLEKDTARYELHIGRKHHHHIICTSCGVIEDIHACGEQEHNRIQKHSRLFAQITDHSLEFFGTCKSCVKN